MHGVLSTVDCDHFRAVPISDGSHLLFTDPTGGLLCLGSDAPIGGPSKLTRKIAFTPDAHLSRRPTTPLCYAAGKALEWGLRIVAAYDDGRLVLYNVPSDLMRQILDLPVSTDVGGPSSVIGQGDALMDSFMNSHPNASTEPQGGNEAASSRQNSIKEPMRVRGALITSVENDIVDDLAVQTEGGGLSVWVFYRSGRAELWNIYAPHGHEKKMRYIGDNGLFYDGLAEDSTEGEEEYEGKGKARAAEWGEGRTGHIRWA